VAPIRDTTSTIGIRTCRMSGLTLSRCSIDSREKSAREMDLRTAVRGLQVRRFETITHRRVKRFHDVRVDEIVFDSRQPGGHIVVHDARLIQTVGFLVGQKTQKVMDQVKVGLRQSVGLCHGSSIRLSL
jgi:hypothetical protein